MSLAPRRGDGHGVKILARGWWKLDSTTSLLALLGSDRRSHKLIRDTVSDRWFVYEFDSDPPEVTSVPKELAIDAVRRHWVEEHEDDRRGNLPWESYQVYLLSDEGQRVLGEGEGERT